MSFTSLIQIPLALFLNLGEVPDFSESPSDTLQSAIIQRDRSVAGYRQDTLLLEKNMGVSELFLQSPALSLSDYGYLSGQKSISFPGLGSSHTSIYLDGFKINNLQSGQIDLGLLCLDNYSDMILDYASSSVQLRSLSPSLEKKFSLKAALGAASFSTWAPDLRVDYALSRNTSMSLYLGGIKSEGDFPYEGGVRTNNDISRYAAQVDFRGRALKGEWYAKFSLNSQDRGVPGSLSYPSKDRQMDNNYFAQASYRGFISSNYDFSFGLRAALDELSYLSEYGDSEYKESDLQLVLDQSYRPYDWMEVSLLCNSSYGSLDSGLYASDRLIAEAEASAELSWKAFKFDLALKYAYSTDNSGSLWHTTADVLSPSLGLVFSPLKILDIKAYARRAYRTPTFNELYYPGYSNPELKAEDVLTSGLAFDYHFKAGECWSFSSSLNTFYNYLKDKIVSAPVEEGSYIWLPYNIGESECYGIGLSFKSEFRREELKASTSLNYSYQYSSELPYYTSHSLSFRAAMEWKAWKASALWALREGRHTPYGDMPSWNTVDFHISRELGTHFRLDFALLNIFDYRYEMVQDYPMQGRNFRICLLYSM